MKQLKQKFKQWVALGVCVCFVFTLFPEAHAALPSLELAVKAETPRVLNIDIPMELASVDEWYQAPSQSKPKLIVHIQDAHSNYEAQTKIRDVIKHLNANHGFKTILVEGAASELDPNILKLFPDQERNIKLTDELAKIGEVTGAEMFLIENSDAAKGVGIEKPELYRKNFDALQKVYSEDEFVSGFFEAYEKKLGQIASRSFGPRMIQALSEWRKFENGHRDFLPFVKDLADLSKKFVGVDLGVLYAQIEWPQLTRLLVLQRVEKELDQPFSSTSEVNSSHLGGGTGSSQPNFKLREQALAEKQQIIDLLKDAANGTDPGSRLSQIPALGRLVEALERFDEKTANLNRIGSSEVRQASAPRALMEALVEEGGKVGFNIREYPAFAKYAGYLILRSEIVPSELFDEIKKLFDLILESLVKDAPSASAKASDDLASRKRLLLLHRDEMLARKLLKLELTHDEWLKVLDRQDRFYPDDLNRRMLEQLGQNTRAREMGKKQASQLRKLNEAFRAAFTFYSAAINRDTFFFQRVQEVLKREDKAILVTGGFHAEGMKYFFRKYDINYGTLTPRITKEFSNEQYRKVMMTGIEESRATDHEPRLPAVAGATQTNVTGSVPSPARGLTPMVSGRGLSQVQRGTDPNDPSVISADTETDAVTARKSKAIKENYLVSPLHTGDLGGGGERLEGVLAAAGISIEREVKQPNAEFNTGGETSREESRMSANDAKLIQNVNWKAENFEYWVKGLPNRQKLALENAMLQSLNKAVREFADDPSRNYEGQVYWKNNSTQPFFDELNDNKFFESPQYKAWLDYWNQSGGLNESLFRNAVLVLNENVEKGQYSLKIFPEFLKEKMYLSERLWIAFFRLDRFLLHWFIHSTIRSVLRFASVALLVLLIDYFLKPLFGNKINDYIGFIIAGEQVSLLKLLFGIGTYWFMQTFRQRFSKNIFDKKIRDLFHELRYRYIFNQNPKDIRKSEKIFRENMRLASGKVNSNGAWSATSGQVVDFNQKYEFLTDWVFNQNGGNLRYVYFSEIALEAANYPSIYSPRVILLALISHIAADNPTALDGLKNDSRGLLDAEISFYRDFLDDESIKNSLGQPADLQKWVSAEEWKGYSENFITRLKSMEAVTNRFELVQSLLLRLDLYFGRILNKLNQNVTLPDFAKARLARRIATVRAISDNWQETLSFKNEWGGRDILTEKILPKLLEIESLLKVQNVTPQKDKPTGSEARPEARVVETVKEFLRSDEGKQAAIGVGVTAGLVVAVPVLMAFFQFLYPLAIVMYALGGVYVYIKVGPALKKYFNRDIVGPTASILDKKQEVKVAQDVTEPVAAVETVEAPSTFEDIEKALEAERVKLEPNKSALVDLAIKLADLAGDIDESERALKVIRDLRSDFKGELESQNNLEASQSTNLIMKVAQLAVKLNQFQQAQKLNEAAEVVVTATAPLESILELLTEEEKAALRSLKFVDFLKQVKADKNYSASQAVAILIAHGFISENDPKAAKNFSKIASLVVAKVAPQQTSDASKMLRTLFPKMFNDRPANLIQVLNAAQWNEEQAQLTLLYLLLNPNLHFRLIVLGGIDTNLSKLKKMFSSRGLDSRFEDTKIPVKDAKTIVKDVKTAISTIKFSSDGEVFLSTPDELGLSSDSVNAQAVVSVNYLSFQFEENAVALEQTIKFAQAGYREEIAGIDGTGTNRKINKTTIANLVERIGEEFMHMFQFLQSA